MDIHAVLGLIGAGIVLVAYLPYILATLRGTNKPNRATWTIWAVAGVILLASYAGVGADTTLPVQMVNAFMLIIIALLSLKFGVGGWTPFDRACLVASFASLLVWYLSGSAFTALGINILVDGIGALPTIKKGFEEPETEDRLTWGLYFVGYTFNLAAVDRWTLEIAGYPIYLFVLCALMAWLLFLRKRKK